MSFAVAATLLAFATLTQAQTPFSSLLFTSSNVTAQGSGDVEYAVCQTDSDSMTPDLDSMVSSDQLSNYPVNSVWFGGTLQTPASDFTVQDCTVFSLNGGRTVDVFSSSATQPSAGDCEVTWFASDAYLTVLVNLTKADAFWSISLPRAPSSVTRTFCYGTRAECLLAVTNPCMNINLLGNALPSFLAGSPSSGGCDKCGTCSAGDYSPDKGLVYGLEASFYPDAFPDCGNTNPDTVYTAPNVSSLKPDSDLQRCQAAPNILSTSSLFPSDPALPSDKYSSCYAVDLKGYVDIKNNTDLRFLTPQPVLKYYSSYRVCLRFSNLVKLYLNGDLLIASTTGDYDTVLTCLDIPTLPQGLVPFELIYSVPPNGVDSVILQFYVIPVDQVASDFRPGHDYQVTYKCECCGLFSTNGGSCCGPVDTCDYRSPPCGPKTPPPAPLPAPPLAPSPTPPLAPSPAPPVTLPPASPPVLPPQPVSPPLPPPKAPAPAPAYPPYVPPLTPGGAPPAEGQPPAGPPATPPTVPPAAPPKAPPPEVCPPSCVCPTTALRRLLAEDSEEGEWQNAEEQKREGVTFSAFKKLVEQAASWDNLEAMLAS